MYEIIERSVINRRKGRASINAIECPVLNLSFMRPEFNDPTIYLYRGDKFLRTIRLPNTTPKAFRDAVNQYLEENHT